MTERSGSGRPGGLLGLHLAALPPSRRPACLRLDVGRVFLIFILVEEAGAMAAALTLGAALDSTAGGAVDLHQQGLIPIKPEGQELPFGQAAVACKCFPPLAQEDGVIRRVLCEDPGGAVGTALHLQPKAFRPAVRHDHGEGVRQVQSAVGAAMEIHNEVERRHAGVGGVPDRKSTRLNSSHSGESRMPSSA